MQWLNSSDILSKLIPIAQVLIVVLTVFTIWASVQRGKLEKREKASLISEVEQTKSTTQDLTQKNVKLENELTETRGKLADLHKQTAPRILLPEQKRKLVQLLPACGSFQIAAASRLLDSESRNYADDLVAVFRDTGWQTGKTNPTFLGDVHGDVVVAITEDAQFQTAIQIIHALNTVGIKARNEAIPPEAISGVRANTIYLIVGEKKQKP